MIEDRHLAHAPSIPTVHINYEPGRLAREKRPDGTEPSSGRSQQSWVIVRPIELLRENELLAMTVGLLR